MELPDQIDTEDQLNDLLTRPSRALVDFIRTIESPLLVLGAGGKMGPTLAVLAHRAAQLAKHPLEVVAISRFGNPGPREWLEKHGVKTISRNLLEATALATLPDASNIIYLVGLKFGTADRPAATWAMNTIVPARIMERFPRARIVAISTGNVYPNSPTANGGSIETDQLTPLGEYPNAAVARERIFEFYSTLQETPISLLRLFYAVELRYGILADIAGKVQASEPIELGNGSFNCIWQGDANEMALRALALVATPPSVWNLCRGEIFSVRETALRFGQLLNKEPRFLGVEQGNALLGNSSRLCLVLGSPAVSLEPMLRWITYWLKKRGRNLGRPTHFEVRDGKY